jgi:hypothetical protein
LFEKLNFIDTFVILADIEEWFAVWAGVDSAWEQDSFEAWKMLVNRADSQPSAACGVSPRPLP